MKKVISDKQKYINIFLCFLMVMICLGFCSSSKGLYLSPITEALGIKRSVFSIGDSIRFITTAIVNAFFGFLVSKFGTKKLICFGVSALIFSSLIYTLASDLIWFYIAGALLGIGFSWTTTTMDGVVVNRSFSKNKGTIMGVVLASNGIGAAVAAQILTPVIYDESTRFGYRRAYLFTVIILVVVLTLIILFYKEKKGVVAHEQPYSKSEEDNHWEGMELSAAERNVYFYVAILCIFVTGMVLQGITGIANAHMKDVGINAYVLGLVASVQSLALSASKFTSGVIYDRIGLRKTTIICNISAIVAVVLLAFLNGKTSGVVMAFVYAFFASMALPLETIMLPIFADDLFGHKSYEKILGIFVSANATGYAIGVPLMNMVYDIFGTYKPVLLIFAGIMFLILVLFQAVISASEKWKTN